MNQSYVQNPAESHKGRWIALKKVGRDLTVDTACGLYGDRKFESIPYHWHLISEDGKPLLSLFIYIIPSIGKVNLEVYDITQKDIEKRVIRYSDKEELNEWLDKRGLSKKNRPHYHRAYREAEKLVREIEVLNQKREIDKKKRRHQFLSELKKDFNEVNTANSWNPVEND